MLCSLPAKPTQTVENPWHVPHLPIVILLSRMTSKHGPDFSHPPPELIRIKEEYKINKIINHWGTAARRQYLIHWKGYSDAKKFGQCSRSIKTIEDYKSLHDSLPPVTLYHPLPCLSSPYPSLPPSPISGTWHSQTCCRILLLLLHYLLPLSPGLLDSWWHPSSHG